MCCFSKHVEFVGQTRIFARATSPTHQVLAYSMRLTAAEDLAMVLPIPVPPGSPDGAVRFIDLSGYPELFADMARAFPSLFPVPAGMLSRSKGMLSDRPPLVVHSVGDFEASFVPSPADFARLDPRFRLPDGVWDALPQYADWGFAVFKLKDLARAASPGGAKIHPMAFELPRRDPARLFFPTVHIHDGTVRRTAHFDHELYCQTAAPPPRGWVRSRDRLGAFLDVAANELIDPDESGYAIGLFGDQKNADTWVDG